MRLCFPRDRLSTASWCAAIAATYTFKVDGDSLRSNLSCRKESTTPIVHLQGSSQREEHQITNRLHSKAKARLEERALAWVIVSSTTGGRSPRSAASRDLDAGANGAEPLRKKALAQRHAPGRGCRQEHEFRKPGTDGPIRHKPAGPVLRSPWPCTLPVREGSLGNAYLHKARGQLCASVSVPRGPRSGSHTTGLVGGKQVYLSFPESTPDQPDHLRMESPFSGECELSWEHIGCTIELPRDVDGRQRLAPRLTPEEEMACHATWS